MEPLCHLYAKKRMSAGPATLMLKFESLLLSHWALNLIKPQWSGCTASVVTRHWRKVQPMKPSEV